MRWKDKSRKLMLLFFKHGQLVKAVHLWSLWMNELNFFQLHISCRFSRNLSYFAASVLCIRGYLVLTYVMTPLCGSLHTALCFKYARSSFYCKPCSNCFQKTYFRFDWLKKFGWSTWFRTRDNILFATCIICNRIFAVE